MNPCAARPHPGREKNHFHSSFWNGHGGQRDAGRRCWPILAESLAFPGVRELSAQKGFVIVENGKKANLREAIAIGFGEIGAAVAGEISLALLDGKNGREISSQNRDNICFNGNGIDATGSLSGVRLCFLAGAPEGARCRHMAAVARDLRGRGIMTVALLMLPSGMEDRESTAIEDLQGMADAVMAFSASGHTGGLAPMEAIIRNAVDCALAMACPPDGLIRIDVEDLRPSFYGTVLHGIGRSDADAAAAARVAIECLERRFGKNGLPGSLLLGVTLPSGKSFADGIDACCGEIGGAFPESPHILLSAREDSDGHGFSAVLLAGNGPCF